MYKIPSLNAHLGIYGCGTKRGGNHLIFKNIQAKRSKKHQSTLAWPCRAGRTGGGALRGCSEKIVKTPFLARRDSGYYAYSIGLRDLEIQVLFAFCSLLLLRPACNSSALVGALLGSWTDGLPEHGARLIVYFSATVTNLTD